MDEIFLCNRMRAKCVTRQLEINKQPAKCIQRDVPHTHHQRHKCNFRFRLQTARKQQEVEAGGGGGHWEVASGKGRKHSPSSVKHNACSTLSSADCNCFSMFAFSISNTGYPLHSTQNLHTCLFICLPSPELYLNIS